MRAPESCGISSAVIERYVRRMDENGFAMHSMLMSRHGEAFFEGYWAPFHPQTHHRMNSVTKSFVGIAIGLLEEEGKLRLTDRIADYFPDQFPDEAHEYIRDLTIYDLLTMRTPHVPKGGHWVKDGVQDRIVPYFNGNAQRPPQMMFLYDSTGSFLLCVIVERLTGKPFVEYLKDRLLRKLGFSEETCCIKGPDGYSWGDSGLLCRQRDLHSFARFIMDGGIWNGERLMNAEFLQHATSRISDTNCEGYLSHSAYGYGFQIWKTYEEGFAFFGMGDQLMICIPKREFIFICTADNQGNTGSRPIILNTLYHDIICELSDEPLPENPAALESLNRYAGGLKLVCQEGEKDSPLAETLHGVTWRLDENPMNIEWFRLYFEGDGGVFAYKNRQGEKKLYFGLGENRLTTFPQEGYPDMQMNTPCPGNVYPCAVSAAWTEETRLNIRVQMTGKHLGGLFIALGFHGDEVGVHMVKNTNCFLNEYAGWASGRAVRQRA